MGPLGTSPRAASTESGDVYVFWLGVNPHQLWGARYTPASGWRGPALLASGLGPQPSPAVSGAETVHVFWKGSPARAVRPGCRLRPAEAGSLGRVRPVQRPAPTPRFACGAHQAAIAWPGSAARRPPALRHRGFYSPRPSAIERPASRNEDAA
jgi:hypothetical protein